MSAEAIAARNSLPWLERQLSMEQVTHHRLKAWGLSKITGLGLGLFAGLAGALAVLISGVVDFFLLPDRWARRYGALGFLTGLPATVAVAVLRPAYAALVLADRILTGTYNAAAQSFNAASASPHRSRHVPRSTRHRAYNGDRAAKTASAGKPSRATAPLDPRSSVNNWS